MIKESHQQLIDYMPSPKGQNWEISLMAGDTSFRSGHFL